MMERKSREYEDVESSLSSETTRFLENINIKDTRKKVQPNRLQILRISVEVFLSAFLLFLFASGSVKLRREQSVPRYGPTLPRKSVILGNTAGLGPSITYNNHEMLWNATEMNHIHRNWQQLFPRK